MVDTEEKQNNTEQKQRPFVLSVILVSLFVYTGTMSLIFLLAILFNRWISNTLSDFFPERDIKTGDVLMLSIIAFVLTTVSFAGVYMMWKLLKPGIFVFSISALSFIGFPFIFGFGNYISIIIISSVVILLLLFWKRYK